MAESQIIHTPDSTGAGVRTISVTTLVNGVPTVVQMQVLSIADDAGNIISDFNRYNVQLATLAELRAIRTLLANWLGYDSIPEGPAVAVQQPQPLTS